ncbi:MAG: DUF4959 domain-containing protein [Bacteroidales bacterium]|jgi:hypothetical protein|nr:DUF4959 domain-containing protein [Bacteroidales bacterium]
MKTSEFLFSIRKGAGVLLTFLILLSTGCKDDTKLGLSSQDGTPPGPPVVTDIKNMNGAAIIYFQAPSDNDLLCVTASYEINGVEYTTKSSVYNDQLKVQGFGKKGDYTVFLRSVDKSGNESEPVEITVNPLESPVELIYESMDVVSGFGGLRLTWENADENNIIVSVFVKDSIGDWINLENFYSSAKTGLGTIRGMDTLSVSVGVTIRDRWDNYSEMLVTTQKPLFEEQLVKSRFRAITKLPNDATPLNDSYTYYRIWDGITSATECFHTPTSGEPGIGKFVTFDMGQLAKLSRFKMWQRTANSTFIYNHNNLKHYIVYGCQEITTEMRATGSLDGWDLICEAHCYKPSGLPGTDYTSEDEEYIKGGDEHEVLLEAPAVRYIRIHMLENWSGGTIAQIAEMTFWGQILENYY